MKSWSNSDTVYPGPLVPEKRLLAAVLQRAITDFLGCDGELRDSARIWLLDDEPTDAPLTFRFICEALDLDFPSLRSAIIRQFESTSGMSLSALLSTQAATLSSEVVDSTGELVGMGAIGADVTAEAEIAFSYTESAIHSDAPQHAVM